MTTLLLLLATVASCLAFACYFLLCDRAQLRRDLLHTRAELAESEDYRDAVKRSALRGHPAVKWRHPHPTPTSDQFYWLHFEEGAPHLHTEEARLVAMRRGALLYRLPSGPEVTTSTVAKSEARAGGELS
jgi:hypothetical protein